MGKIPACQRPIHPPATGSAVLSNCCMACLLGQVASPWPVQDSLTMGCSWPVCGFVVHCCFRGRSFCMLDFQAGTSQHPKSYSKAVCRSLPVLHELRAFVSQKMSHFLNFFINLWHVVLLATVPSHHTEKRYSWPSYYLATSHLTKTECQY